MGKERKVAARTNVQIGLASAHGPRRPSPRPWIFMDVGYWILDPWVCSPNCKSAADLGVL